jgi:hypothetical protein
MNVLILTPDAVGSTLLQRMLTIYMQFHEFDRPVINLHELTNGLAKYYSPEFNQELVSKKTVQNWGYYQTLEEVVELLSRVDHYKTSRLAHYHIRRRGDTVDQQVPFYNYLNDNFYIIACKRANVFEHALSMTLNKITKKLNVYNAYEKIDTFYEMYQSGITLDSEVFVKQLDAYKLYINWSEQYFNIGSYFNYEQDVPRLEQYILDLPVFSKQSNRVTWDKNFGISFNNWNKMHYVRSDLTELPPSLDKNLKNLTLEKTNQVEDYQQHAPKDWPSVFSVEDINNLPITIKQQWSQSIINREGIISLLSQEKQQILSRYKQGYDQAQQTIDQMIDLGIIITGPPIKKQTLIEKRNIIKNFDDLVKIYNAWIDHNPDIALPINNQNMSDNIHRESEFWNSIFNLNNLPLALPPNQQ